MQARGAFITLVEGLSPERGYSWWASWDRFHVPGLILQSAQGKRVAPPIAGALRTVDSWHKEKKKPSP